MDLRAKLNKLAQSSINRAKKLLIKNTSRPRNASVLVLPKLSSKILFLIIPLMLILASPLQLLTVAYEVKCDGQTLGFVSNTNVLEEASLIVDSHLNNADLEITPTYSVAIIPNDQLVDANQLSDKILDNSHEVVESYGFYVDQSFVCATLNKDEVNSLLEDIKTDYKNKTKADFAFIINKIEFKEGYYSQSEVLTKDEIKEKLSSDLLKVQTSVVSSRTVKVKPDTQTVFSNDYFEGYKKEVTQGKLGVEKKVTTQVFINGVLQKDLKTTQTIVKSKAQAKKTIHGDKSSPLNVNPNAKFAFPVKQVSSAYVNVGFRGYRGHTGLDICAAKGTPVYAAQTGTVVKVVHQNYSYGNHIVIKHDNTYSTLYSHCNTINVKKGDAVKMGDLIGTVGRTGRATGNHLHFEVIKNGVAVNPASYIGVN